MGQVNVIKMEKDLKVIKFRNILKEEFKGPKEYVEEFLEYVDSGNWIIPQKDGIDLFRGTDREVKVGVKEKYTDVREPMNTDPSIQDVVDEISKVRYPSRPQRRYSRFASTRLSATKSYGTPHYVFPEQDSKIVSYERDVFVHHFSNIDLENLYLIFRSLGGYVGEDKNDLYDFLRNYFHHDVISVIQAYIHAQNGDLSALRVLCRNRSLKRQMDIMKNAAKHVFDHEKDFFGLESKKAFNYLHSLMRKHYFFIEDFKDYFDSGKKGIVPDSYEVVIEGDLLHARADFVDNYLKFNENTNSWEVDLQ